MRRAGGGSVGCRLGLERGTAADLLRGRYQSLDFILRAEKVKVLVGHSCPTLCSTLDSRPPGSSVHGILQARILEWVAIPFSRGSS